MCRIQLGKAKRIGEKIKERERERDGAKNGRMQEPMAHQRGPYDESSGTRAARGINTVADPTPVFPQRRRIPGSRL